MSAYALMDVSSEVLGFAEFRRVIREALHRSLREDVGDDGPLRIYIDPFERHGMYQFPMARGHAHLVLGILR